MLRRGFVLVRGFLQLRLRGVCLLSDGHWRNLTARKMPWRTRSGQEQVQAYSNARGLIIETVGTDSLAERPPPPRWTVPGPLGAVIRAGSAEYQAWCPDGRRIVMVTSDGRLARMDRTAYEMAVGVRERQVSA